MDYDLVSAYLRLGQVYDLQGRRPEAIELYLKAISLNNRSSAIIVAKGYLNEPYSTK